MFRLLNSVLQCIQQSERLVQQVPMCFSRPILLVTFRFCCVEFFIALIFGHFRRRHCIGPVQIIARTRPHHGESIILAGLGITGVQSIVRERTILGLCYILID
uniref:Uncharacterized protein n=1 Tax=Cacopsylla melanoneura TaxID=428564 RepID=A0A8D8ZRA0_9HEMI